MGHVPALLLEMAATAEQDLKSLNVVDIVESQKDDPLLCKRSSGGVGWKRVCEFSASDSRRDRNTIPAIDCLELHELSASYSCRRIRALDTTFGFRKHTAKQ